MWERVRFIVWTVGFYAVGWIGTVWAGETGQIAGQAISLPDRLPLPGVTVRVLHTPWTAVSDTDGRFQLIGIPPGVYTVVCEAEGFTPVRIADVQVRVDVTTEITCAMTLKAAAVIEVEAEPPVDRRQPATRHLITRAQSKAAIPPDIFSQAKLVPGVVQNGEILDFVFIRGTPQRATALQVEGLDARNAVHLSTGVPVFAKGALEAIEVMTGGLAPEYGNAIGGVLNSVISGGEGERTFYGDVSFIASDAAPFDTASRAADQRLLQTEIGWNPRPTFGLKVAFAHYAGDGMPWTFRVNDDFANFTDLWLVARWQPNTRHRFKWIYARGRGAARFHSGPTQEGVEVPTLFWQTRPHANDLALFAWYGQAGGQTIASLQIGYLRTRDGTGPTWDGDQDFLTPDALFTQTVRAGTAGRLWSFWPEITFYTSRRYQARFSIETMRWSGHTVKTVFEAQFIQIPEGYYRNFMPVWILALAGCPEQPTCPLPIRLPLTEFPLWVDYTGNGTQIGWALQDEWTLRPGLRLLYGARVDYWSYMEQHVMVSPRLSLTWEPRSGTILRIGGGLFAQPVPPAAAFLKERNRFTILSSVFPELTGGTILWTRTYVTNPDTCRQNVLLCDFARTDMVAEKAVHFELEGAQFLGKDWAVRISLYYRRLWDMVMNGRGFRHPAGVDMANRWPDALVNGGKGRAYGAEISLVRIRGPLRGWIAYTYAVAEGTFPSADYRGGGILDGTFRPLNFDIRHQIQVNLDWSTDWAGGLDISTQFRWNTGYPATRRYWHRWTCTTDPQSIGLPPPGALPIGPDGCIYIPDIDPRTGFQRQGLFNAERMPNFLKWDIKIEKVLWHRGTTQLRLVVQADNVLNAKNYGTWSTEQNSYIEIDADTGQVITQGARLADRRFQIGVRLLW